MALAMSEGIPRAMAESAVSQQAQIANQYELLDEDANK